LLAADPGDTFRLVRGNPGVFRYLMGLSHACLEAARDPRLLGVLLGVLRLAPKTLAELAR